MECRRWRRMNPNRAARRLASKTTRKHARVVVVVSMHAPIADHQRRRREGKEFHSVKRPPAWRIKEYQTGAGGRKVRRSIATAATCIRIVRPTARRYRAGQDASYHFSAYCISSFVPGWSNRRMPARASDRPTDGAARQQISLVPRRIHRRRLVSWINDRRTRAPPHNRKADAQRDG